MKEAYKYVAGKIAAYDDEQGIIEYDYQDNIEDVLKQENVVEQISNDIEDLKEKEKCYEVKKESLISLFFTEGFGDNLLMCVGTSALIMFGNFFISRGFNPLPETVDIFFKSLAGIALASSVPIGIKGYKKAKMTMEAKLENIREQIAEFEEILKKAEAKKIAIKNNKTAIMPELLIDKSNKNIDNSKIEVISSIEKKKQLYNYFRTYISRIENLNTIENLNDEYDTEFTENDVQFIDDMASRNSVLSKNKKH